MNTRMKSFGSSRRPLATGCAILLGLSGSVFAQVFTGDFSAANLGTGNFDAQVGIDPLKEYFAKVNLGEATNLTINGVEFIGVGGADPVGTNFSLTGVPNVFPGGGANPGGVLGALTDKFVYGGGVTPEILTLNGLTVGETYVVTFYNRSWEAAGARRQAMTASGASSGGGFTFDEDMGATGQGSLNVLRYTFQAATAQQLINFVAQTSGSTMHQYGFSVERTFNNGWLNGTNWTGAGWTTGAPNSAGANAVLPAQSTPTAINLDTNVTLGHLQFDGTNAWTVDRSANQTLTFRGDVGGVSNLSAKAGSHRIVADVVLENKLRKVGAGTVTMGGVVSGAQTVHLLGGSLRMEGANTYTGETIMGAGTVLEVTTLSNYGVASGIGARTFSQENTTATGVGLHFQGGTLRFVGSTPQSTNRHIRMLNGNGATIDASGTTPEATMSFTNKGPNINLFDTGGVRTLNLTGTNTGANTFAIHLTNQAANATSINKSGAGTWHLTNDANSYTGLTQISGGILNVSSLSDYGVPSAIGARTAAQEVVAGNGIGIWFGPGLTTGTLQYTGSLAQSTNRQIRVGTGGAIIDASGSVPGATLSFTHSGPNTNLFDTAGVRAITLTGANKGANTFAIQLTDQAANFTHVNKRGEGTWHLTNVGSTYGGVTAIEGGVLNVASLSDYGLPSAIGNRASTADVSTNIGIVFRGGTLQYTGTTPQTTNRAIRVSTNGGATIDASGALPGATLSFTAASSPDFFENSGSRSLTLTGTNTGENTFGMAITEIGGQTTLNKNGSGTWVLTGASTYTGATNVNAGTLRVNGSLANTAVAVANGATVGGAGTIGGTVIVSGGGHIAPGSGVGTLNVNSLVLAPGSLLDHEFNGVAGDTINVGGAGGLVLNGGSFNLYAEGGTSPFATNGTYTLLDYNTNFGGSLSNLSVFNSQAGKNYTITNDAVGTAIQVGISDAVVNEWSGGAGSGQWTSAGNWNGGTPNAAGVFARFGSTPASPSTVALNGSKTVAGLVFDNANSYTISGGAADVLTLDNGSGAGNLTVLNGIHTVQAPLALSGHLNTSLAAGSRLTLANAVSGAGQTVAVNGPGTLILGADNTFGDTIVNSGTLQVGNGGTAGSLGSGYVSLAPGANLMFNRSNGITVANNLLGAEGILTQSGSGILNLTGTNTVGSVGLGRVGIDAGSIVLGSDSALPANVALAFGGAGTLDLNGHAIDVRSLSLPIGTITDNSPISGETTVALHLTETTIVTGAITNGSSRTLAVALQSGTLQIGDGGNQGILNVGRVDLNPGTALVFDRNDDFSVGANITGKGVPVTKLGAGTLALDGTNDFGLLDIQAGGIVLTNNAALSSSMAVNVVGRLDLNGLTATMGTLSGSGLITDSAVAGTVTTLTVNQDVNSTFTGSVANGPSQTVALTKTGNGTLTLGGTAANAYTGTTTVNGGTLLLQKTGGNAILGNVQIGDGAGSDLLVLGAANQIADTSVLTFTAGGSGNSAFFRMGGFNETVRGIQTTVGQSAVIENTTANTTATLTVDTSGNDYTYDGIIRQSGTGGVFALTKTGAGTLTLATTNAVANNSYTGQTNIDNGKLVLENLAAFASPIAINQPAQDALVINQTTRDMALNAVLSGPGGVVKNGPATLTLGGTNSITGAVTVNDGILGIGNDAAFGSATIVMNGGNIRAAGAPRTLGNSIIANGDFTVGRLTNFNGPITLNANVTITANNPDGPANGDTGLGGISGNFRVSFAEGAQGIGSGALVINGVNSNSGGTRVLSGRVNVSGSGALANAPLTVDGGELNLNHFGQTVSSLSGNGGTLNLGAGHQLTVDQSIDTVFAGNLGGAGSLIKEGDGTLALNGSGPSFSGTTTVNDGTLLVNGSLSGSKVLLNDATLGGIGAIGSVNSIGGAIAPGASAGTLSTAGLSLDSTSLWDFELATAGVVGSGVNDLILVNGALTLDGILDVTPLPGFGAGTYRLASYTGGFVDNGLEIDPAFLASYPGSSIDTTNVGEVNLIVIPEPGSVVLLIGGLAIATASRRRRPAE